MKKTILAAVGTVLAASSLGGCITQTGFHWSDDGPKKNETVKGLVDLKGVESLDVRRRGPAPTEAHYFLILGGTATDDVEFKGFKFDPEKVLGPSVKMIKDPDIAGFASSNCTPGGPGDEIAFVTVEPVPAEPMNKVFDATFKATLGANGSGFAGILQSGQWYDDGDGVAEAPASPGDQYECTGFTTTVLSTKGFAAEPPMP